MDKLTIEQIHERLLELGLMDENKKPITFAGFKKMADIHKYGRGWNELKIVFVHRFKANMFGFYGWGYQTKVEALKTAYSNLESLCEGIMYPYDTNNVQWGNCGIPLSYGRLRSI